MEVGTHSLARVWRRIYADFFMPSRLEIYRANLRRALENDYRVCSVSSFWNRATLADSALYGKTLIIRHDIDTDIATTRAIWQIERDLGVLTSFYFRLATADTQLMREISASGAEVSYHYEELSDFAKEKGLKSPEAIKKHLPEIRARFAQNLGIMRRRVGAPMRVVAYHGDFINFKLGVLNNEILMDADFRKQVGVELDADDGIFTRQMTRIWSDTSYPDFWISRRPPDNPERKGKAIYITTHPRHWRVSIKANLRYNLNRALEGVHFWMRSG